MVRKENIDKIVEALTIQFRSFGGGQTSQFNPFVNALKDNPPQFAASVDIREVVEAVLVLNEVLDLNTKDRSFTINGK